MHTDGRGGARGERSAPLEHTPARPSWDCRQCGKPWPCDPAREAFAVEYKDNHTGLIMLMWDMLEHYINDVGDGPLGETWERFMAWARALK